MIQDIAYENLKLPGFIVSLALSFLGNQIRSKVHTDIFDTKPIDFASHIKTSCLFIIGNEDKLVYPKRVEEMFHAYLGKTKSIIRSNGDHSSEREPYIINHCFQFIAKELNKLKHHFDQNHVFDIKPTTNSLYDNKFNEYAEQFIEKVKNNVLRSSRGRNDNDKRNSMIHKGSYTFK